MLMPGATTGNISITTGAGSSTSGSNFTVTAIGTINTQDGAKLTPTGQTGAAQFGSSVAVSADGNTAAVGGWIDNSTRGAVFVFVKSGGVWTQQGSKLVGTGGCTNCRQGTYVAISADGNTILSGEYQDVTQELFVFRRTGTTWSQEAMLPNPGGERFGCGLALSADGNTAAIGGFYAFSNQGRTWIYTRSGATWSLQQTLSPSNFNTGGGFGGPLFGTSNALSADGNTLAVGAYADGDLVTNGGAVYVFTRTGVTWSQQTKYAPSLANGTGLGTSVSLSADGNTLAAGAPGGNSGSGLLLILTRSGTTWTREASLLGTGAVGGQQGSVVSLRADGNLVASSTRFDGGNIGATWIFTRSGTTWTQQGTKLVGTGNVGQSNQGWSMMVSSDGSTLMTGGFTDNANQGAVWVFIPQPAPTITSFTPSSACANTTSVVITGTGFTGVSDVSIGGTAVGSFTVNSATQITATVGGGTTGTISVTTPGGTGTSSGTLTVNPIPTINIAPVGSTTICEGSDITLVASTNSNVALNGLNFNGTGNIAVSNVSGIPIGNSSYTIEAWIKPNAVVFDGIAGWGSYGATNQVNAFRLTGPTQMTNYWWGNDLTVNVPNLSDGNWHHVVATFDGTTRAIYTDGVMRGSDTPSGHNVSGAGNLTIGYACPNCAGTNFSGDMDEVRIWNIGRTQFEIQSTMSTRVPASSPGLVLYYRMDETSGPTTLNETNNSTNVGALGAGISRNTPSIAPIYGDYTWTTGSVAGAINVAPSTSTSYSVTVTSLAGCTNSTSQMVTVLPLPTSVVSGGGTVCVGTTLPDVSIALTGNGPWDLTYTNGTTPTTVIGTNTNPYLISGAAVGNYTVTVLSDADCVALAGDMTGGTSVNTNPYAAQPALLSPVSSPTTICPGTTTTLEAVALADHSIEWRWFTGAFGGTIATSTSNPLTTPNLSSPRTYYAYQQNTLTGCWSEIGTVARVNISAIPSALAGADRLVCPATSTQVGPGSAVSGWTYSWSPSTLLSSNTVNRPTVQNVPTGYNQNYTLTVTNALGCTATDIVNVSAHSITNLLGAASAGQDVAVCSGQPAMLGFGSAPASGFTYTWTPGHLSRH